MNAWINEMIWSSPFINTRKGKSLDMVAQLVGPQPAHGRASENVSGMSDAVPCVTRRSGPAASVGWVRSLPTRLRCWLGWRGWRELQPVTGRF